MKLIDDRHLVYIVHSNKRMIFETLSPCTLGGCFFKRLDQVDFVKS